MKSVLILGSTGSIGSNTLEVIRKHPGKFTIKTIVAGKNAAKLIEQINEFHPENAIIANESLYKEVKANISNARTSLTAGAQAVLDAVKEKHDIAIAAITGIAGLIPIVHAIPHIKTLGIANKESLVCAGSLIIDLTKKHKVKVIPIDSEHNAIFQIFDKGMVGDIKNVILTASGGPFLNKSLEEMAVCTPEDAMKHPNWKMGKKISIDSATMMNKTLEVIEAVRLFDIDIKKIAVLVHKESIVHGMIQYGDGSLIAQMSNHDMQIPISLALMHPKRAYLDSLLLDLSLINTLTFLKPDYQKFPSLKLAEEVVLAGDYAAIILNAANEVSVESFLNNKIGFLKIYETVASTIEKFLPQKVTSVEDVLEIDARARESVKNLINKL